MSAARDELHPALLLMTAAGDMREQLIADRALFSRIEGEQLTRDVRNQVRFRIRALDAQIAELQP